tara:strand:+ start:103 stop:702 length:600 start_codon:yes stop_codon:yes gene_type:complete
MVNAWSLAASILGGTFEEDYPVMKKPDDFKIGIGNTAAENDGLDYEVDLYESASFDCMSDIDDQYSHHFGSVTLYDDYDTDMNITINGETEMRDHRYKYHEDEILKDIQEYVSSTYNGHYTGSKNEFRKVQTIDLMAARDLASDFCQANILKYGSRYGSKDGRNKKDLMKVIHYAMLLAHFDGHYGEPSMPSGNFDQMP